MKAQSFHRFSPSLMPLRVLCTHIHAYTQERAPFFYSNYFLNKSEDFQGCPRDFAILGFRQTFKRVDCDKSARIDE